MKKLLRKLFLGSVYVALSAQVFSAVDEVNLEIRRNDSSTEIKKVKLQKVEDNTYRLDFPVHEQKYWWRIIHIDVKHTEANAQKGDDGYWILSDGRLGYFTREKAPSLVERRQIMPIYGFKKGDSAFVGIVKGLKYEFSMNVDVKDGKYSMYPRFLIGDIHTKPYENLIIDFTFFKGANANYSSMARKYRKYQLDRGEVMPLKERVKGNPRLKYMVGSMFIKLAPAWYMRDSDMKSNRGPHWDPVDDPPVNKIKSFDELKEDFKQIKALGVNQLDICLTNWNLRSNGRNPTCSMAEPELGGNAKLKELNALAKDLGFQVAPHILHTEFYTISDEFDANDIAVDHKGKYKGYSGMGGKGFNPCFKQVYKKYILPHYDRMDKLGFTLMHIDVTSAIVPYDCHHIEHFSTRQETAEYMNKVGMLSDAFFGAWSSEGPCDHVANTLDFVLYVSAYPKYLGKHHELMDTMVPFWQLAYHGIILSNPFFFKTNSYNCYWTKSKEEIAEARLKLVEFGGRPMFYGGVLSKNVDYKILKEAYDEYEKRKHLQYEFMDFHGELAKNVYVTRFSDGSEIVTNYTDKPFSYKDKTIAPMDYQLLNSKK
ncbi:MAG: hypothetical protein E7035_05035 [Verrucomicrobiaceae bacterium]|nr:hypothetical protein [Verrucomicrobiaceae bacterium]